MGKPGTGNTVSSRREYIASAKRTGGSETSQYPRMRNQFEIPPVAASERGRAQTKLSNKLGVVGLPQGVARRVIKSAHR